MKKQINKKGIAQFAVAKIQKKSLIKIKGGEDSETIVIEEEIIN